MDTTAGTLLGGKVRYSQMRQGFRTGIEPVLLAVAIPARAGARVLEAGTGAGAGLLCLAARVPGILGLGIDRDADVLRVARANAMANGASGLLFAAADIDRLPLSGCFDHAFANPPYHNSAATLSPAPERRAATHAPTGAVETWAAALAACLRHEGTLTLILPPSRLPEALAGCRRAGCDSLRLFPLWSGAGRPAKLLLLRAVKGGRAPLVLLPGLILHEADGRFTAAAEAHLRSAASLEI